MNLPKFSPVSQFLLVIGAWAILIFAFYPLVTLTDSWVENAFSRASRATPEARYLKNNPAMGVPLAQLQWGERPSTEEVGAKHQVAAHTEAAIIEMNAAKSRWHSHRAESLRFKKYGHTYDAIREDRLADEAYDEYNMYYHRIQSGNFPHQDRQDRLFQSRREEAILFAEINKGIIDRAAASKVAK